MRRILIVLIACAFIVGGAQFALADDDAILDLKEQIKALQKTINAQQETINVLSAKVQGVESKQAEVDKALKETKVEVKRQNEFAVNGELPSWIQKTKLSGDLRLRWELKDRKGSADDSKGRIRYRLGVDSKVVDGVTIGAGLATGSNSSTSARSTNQDLDNAFSTKEISLDYAYVEYSPTDWADIIAGKFKRKKYLWEPSDLLWDTDIRPEGASVQLRHELEDSGVNLLLNTGYWIIEDKTTTANSADPYLIYAQSMVALKNEDLNADAKFAVTAYDFENVKGGVISDTEGTNTLSSGVLANKYTPIALGGEIGLNDPLDIEFIPRVSVFGEYVMNIEPVDEDTGWLLGAKIGDKKVKGKNQWQLKYQYAELGKDAFLDAFPDADRYGGGTDIKSHEVILQYGLNKNVVLELDYYHSVKDVATANPEDLIQTSAMFKF